MRKPFAGLEYLKYLSEHIDAKHFLINEGIPEKEAIELAEIWKRDKLEYCRRAKKYKLLEIEEAEN